MLQRIECARLRRKSFSKRIPYDEELRQIVGDEPSHWFLVNPASQNTYLYQVEFVQTLSEQHFGRPLSEIDILDWGCGKGQVTYLLRRRGAQVTSCDYRSADESDGDSTFGQATPIVKSAAIPVDALHEAVRLPYPDARFDVVLSVGVLEHVPNDLESLKEIHRVLLPQGILFCFNLPYCLSWTQRLAHLRGDFYHDRLYSESSTTRLLEGAGFDLVDLWHRQLFPKNSFRYPFYRAFESLDQSLVRVTPLKYLATNIEFVALAHKRQGFSHEHAVLGRDAVED